MSQIKGQHECPNQSLHCFCDDSGLIGILRLSAKGIIWDVNPYAAEMLKISTRDLCGMQWETLLYPEDVKAVNDWWQCLWQTQQKTTLEIRFRRKDGHPVHTMISAAILPDPMEHCFLLVLDITATKLKEKQTLRDEQRLRDTLIREVHHRIKNNLQGIVGLLHNQILQRPELAEALETPIRQINSIALTYGLRSYSGNERIYLCELTRVAARAGQKSSSVPLTMDIPHYQSIEVNDGEAVSIALVINELLFNAMKHGYTDTPKVTLALHKEGKTAAVLLSNRYQGPPLRLDLDTGTGLGTGLQLVCSLLPRDGSAELVIRQQGDEVITKLKLHPPLVHITY